MRNSECGMWNLGGARFIPRLRFSIFDRTYAVARRGLWSRVSCLAVVFLLLSVPAVVHAELLDRVVAAVNNEMITLSELNQAVGFNVAFGGKNGEKLRSETLEGLINRKLLVQEAYRLKFVEVSDQDVNGEVEKLKKRLGSDQAFSDFLAKLDMTGDQLASMLGERLLVERFVEKKIGLFVRVSRDEAQDYYNKHAAAFKGRQFQDVQKPLTAMLSEQRLGQQTAQYLAELRGRADIRENR